MIYSTIAQCSLVALLCVTTLAAMVEDRIVRLSALLHALNWFLVAALQRRHQHHAFQTADFLVDITGAAIACWLVTRSTRIWPAALAAFQILGALNYLLPVLDPSILHRASVTTSYIWEMGALAALAFGAAESWDGTKNNEGAVSTKATSPSRAARPTRPASTRDGAPLSQGG
jgi:hypothetical protein